VVVDTSQETPEESVAKIIAKLEELGYVPPAAKKDVYSSEEQQAVEDRLRALGYI